jgi:hypothetical protein
LERIIRKAGLTPWPKLFQNLRSTRETELAESYPIHVVCKWIGNRQAVAREHYLQLTDEHFGLRARARKGRKPRRRIWCRLEPLGVAPNRTAIRNRRETHTV